jgi:hypothetical protein
MVPTNAPYIDMPNPPTSWFLATPKKFPSSSIYMFPRENNQTLDQTLTQILVRLKKGEKFSLGMCLDF